MSLFCWWQVPDALSRQLRDGNCVAMRDLRKDFQTPTGIKKAVDGLSLTLYSGQITALLGHNGAGVWPLSVSAALFTICCMRRRASPVSGANIT